MSWPYSQSDDILVIAHKSLQKITQDLFKCIMRLTSNPLCIQPKHIKHLQKYWSHFGTILRCLHDNDDINIIPWMRARVDVPNKVSHDHFIVMKSFAVCDELITDLSDSIKNVNTTLNELFTEFKYFCSVLNDQIVYEQDVILPLLRTYFTYEEYCYLDQDVYESDLDWLLYHMNMTEKNRWLTQVLKLPFAKRYGIVLPRCLKYDMKYHNLVKRITHL